MEKHIKNCLNCGKEIFGKINKLFCKDACRKRFKRHGGVGYSGVFKKKNEKEPEDKSFQEKKANELKNNVIETYALKKLIDVGANFLESKLINKPIDQKLLALHPSSVPLKIQTAASNFNQSNKKAMPVLLSEDFKEFLGNISYPFRMLVWGMPGDGKSTFCMRLANEITNQYKILYVSGEEALDSDTTKDKQERSIAPKNLNSCVFINRLPANQEEWKGVFEDHSNDNFRLRYIAVFYDSITKLGITPFYIDAVKSDCNMNYFNGQVSHIFISHAHKDGSTYRGDGSWGHEVDIVIRCEKGIAIIEKNRFGTLGNTFKIY